MENCRFAAEVFHGLQEDAMKTASRSQKLMVRVQNIEATFPALEKAALAQTSHIHFAYTAGMAALCFPLFFILVDLLVIGISPYADSRLGGFLFFPILTKSYSS